jgi:hypothetical protein
LAYGLLVRKRILQLHAVFPVCLSVASLLTHYLYIALVVPPCFLNFT